LELSTRQGSLGAQVLGEKQREDAESFKQ